MKKLIISCVALMASASSIAQSVNFDLSPVKTTVGKIAIDAVKIGCFVFLIVGLFGAAYEYHKDNSAAVKGFIMMAVLAGIILATTYVAQSAFLN